MDLEGLRQDRVVKVRSLRWRASCHRSSQWLREELKASDGTEPCFPAADPVVLKSGSTAESLGKLFKCTFLGSNPDIERGPRNLYFNEFLPISKGDSTVTLRQVTQTGFKKP